jgi:uncharacterized protein YcfJ
MRCIINVGIGGRYPKEQKRLAESLKQHFDGDFLAWTDFPNDNYNKENMYNAKAAAFEEAIHKGYKQILWVDCPVVALKDVAPIFDRIIADGYLTMKNFHYNCAQTCSDACLAHFKVTRDEAEKFQEHAGGIIGIDMNHPNGKKLIERFIEGCKAGACDGSRTHDGQSKDPRFKFHRQCQSVISLAANTLGLKPTMEWNKGVITLCPEERTKDTILCWSHRGRGRLPEMGGGRRTRRRQRGGNTTAKAKESYIYLKTTGGLNDNLVQLAYCTEYAKKHGRSIILEMPTYAASDLSTIFDFTTFPVPLYTNYKEKQKELAGRKVVPDYYGTLEHPHTAGLQYVRGAWHSKDGRILRFHMNRPYPSDLVLVYACGGGGAKNVSVELLGNFRLTKEFREYYEQKKKEYSIPAEYISIHLRSTDRKLQITNNISGMLLKDSDAIVKRPSSGNTHADSLEKVDLFIKAHPGTPVFVSGDNPKLLEKLTEKYPTILTNKLDRENCKSNRACTKLHHFGKTDPNNLRDAIADLIILAGAKAIMTSAGGYSRLAKKLLQHKHILEKLLS